MPQRLVILRINNCVGEDNHYSFMQLSVYACLMSAWVFFMLCLHRWWWPDIKHTEVVVTSAYAVVKLDIFNMSTPM